MSQKEREKFGVTLGDRKRREREREKGIFRNKERERIKYIEKKGRIKKRERR